MLPTRTLLPRLGLVLLAAVAPAVMPPAVAWADDDEDDDGDDGDDDGDDGDDGEDGEEEEEDQPPVTAGGLYTLASYPVSEISRPLTISKGMKEFRAGIDVDVSADTAFENWGLGLNFRYGLEDNVELQADFRTSLTTTDLRAAAAIEASIVYDLVDVRVGVVVPVREDAATGESSTTLDFELGFPFRYAPKPELGVVALDTFMTFNTSGKPDLTPSIGIVSNPLPQLAIKLTAKLTIPDFDTDAEGFAVPVTANIQFTPKSTLDLGGEFSFPNLSPPDGTNFYDQRMLLLYGQLRF